MSRVGRYLRFQITGLITPSTTGLSPALVRRSSTLRLTSERYQRGLGTVLHLDRTTPHWQRVPARTPTRFRLCPVRSPLLRASSLFLGVLRCFSSPGSLPSKRGDGPSRPPGCPIRRSLDYRLPAPPQSISSRGHVLHRRPAPRHPPCAHHSGRPAPHRFGRVDHPARLVPRRDNEGESACCLVLGRPATRLFASVRAGQDCPQNARVFPCLPRLVPESTCDRPLHLSRCFGRWSRGGSNPEPPPCKGGALPVELRPRPRWPVGAPGLEPGTSALSGPRSNQLSYAPAASLPGCHTRRPKMEEAPSPIHGSVRKQDRGSREQEPMRRRLAARARTDVESGSLVWAAGATARFCQQIDTICENRVAWCPSPQGHRAPA